MTSDRRLGWLLVFGGVVLAVAAQVASPVGVPLYDGVVVQEPYRYLHPTGDQVGTPTSFNETKQVTGSVSPAIAAATLESPPQAQLVALADAFEVPSGVTSIVLTVEPIEPPAVLPTNGTIAGNVYRFAVADPAGTELRPKACEGCRSLSMRGPEGIEDAAIQRFDGTAWVEVPTDHASITGFYQTNVTVLGDYAIVAGAPIDAGPDPVLILAGVAIAVIAIAGIGLFVLRRQGTPRPPVRTGPERGRVPSKRKGPRRPPTGRAGR